MVEEIYVENPIEMHFKGRTICFLVVYTRLSYFSSLSRLPRQTGAIISPLVCNTILERQALSFISNLLHDASTCICKIVVRHGPITILRVENG